MSPRQCSFCNRDFDERRTRYDQFYRTWLAVLHQPGAVAEIVNWIACQYCFEQFSDLLDGMRPIDADLYFDRAQEGYWDYDDCSKCGASLDQRRGVVGYEAQRYPNDYEDYILCHSCTLEFESPIVNSPSDPPDGDVVPLQSELTDKISEHEKLSLACLNLSTGQALEFNVRDKNGPFWPDEHHHCSGEVSEIERDKSPVCIRINNSSSGLFDEFQLFVYTDEYKPIEVQSIEAGDGPNVLGTLTEIDTSE